MTLEQLKQANSDAGRHFFSSDTMRFFRSRISSRIYTGADGAHYLVTSERGPDRVRRYSVRVTRDGGVSFDTLHGFQAYRTSAQAHAAARYAAHGV
jgi:hypothetical protein